MALQIDRTDENTGLTILNAYCRVITVRGGKDNGFNAGVGVYSSKDARDAGKKPAFYIYETMPYVEDPGGDNILQTTYEYLKTLDNWAGATDV